MANGRFGMLSSYFFPRFTRDYYGSKSTIRLHVNSQRNELRLRLRTDRYLYLPLRKRPCYVTRPYLVSCNEVPHDLKIKG
jgi:hypothetical protein